jgi:hypothetical protein
LCVLCSVLFLRRRRSCLEANIWAHNCPSDLLGGRWCRGGAGTSQVVSKLRRATGFNKIGQEIAIPLKATDRLFFFRGPLTKSDTKYKVQSFRGKLLKLTWTAKVKLLAGVNTALMRDLFVHMGLHGSTWAGPHRGGYGYGWTCAQNLTLELGGSAV